MKSKTYKNVVGYNFVCLSINSTYRVLEQTWEIVLRYNISMIITTFGPLFGTIGKLCLSTFRVIFIKAQSFGSNT